MMHVHYALGASFVHGIGLFAGQSIRRGEVIYTPSPVLDLNISGDQFRGLDVREQKEILHWGYRIPDADGYHVDFDMSKFINHSKEPTIIQDPSTNDVRLVAIRNIRSGEELTQNYLDFEDSAELLRRGILPH